MGYNTWYDMECTELMEHNMVRLTADLFVLNGLAALGYEFINLDDCYISHVGRVNGTLHPDEARFGGVAGIKDLADYVHSKGLKFGLYTDRGTKTCAGLAAAQGHEAVDAQTYADWGVDYLKEDSCNAPDDEATAIVQYGLMRDALNATGRPIFFSTCGWHEWYAPPNATLNYTGGHSLANAARIGPDDTNWKGVLINTDVMAVVNQYARPGYWNDPCLLLSKDAQGNLRVTELQSRAQFALWCVMSAPLLISGSLSLMSAYTLATYSNRQAIAINQADGWSPGSQWSQLRTAGRRLAGTDLSSAECGDKPATGAVCVNAWGKALTLTSWALLLLNAGSAPLDVSCGAACLGEMNIHALHFPLNATDVYAGPLPAITSPTVVAKALPAMGGFVLLVLNTTNADVTNAHAAAHGVVGVVEA